MSKSLWLRALHTTRRSFDEGARSELFLAVLRSPYHSLTRVHVLAYAFAAQQGILEVKPVFHTAPLCSSKCLFAPSAMSCCLQEEMQREAHSIVAERRGPEISALRTEDGWDGVFAWAGGPPRAGAAGTACLQQGMRCHKVLLSRVHYIYYIIAWSRPQSNVRLRHSRRP